MTRGLWRETTRPRAYCRFRERAADGLAASARGPGRRPGPVAGALLDAHLADGQRAQADLLLNLGERLFALGVLHLAHGLSHWCSRAASLDYLPRGGARRGRWGCRPAGQPCRIDVPCRPLELPRAERTN